MTIQFLCPNGHRIRCPDEQAGRAAKCPKCGVKFRIPELSELQVSGSGSDISPAELESFDAMDHALAEDEIEFLCPNGHRLHGPSSLQGRPGECPECGSKFRVPSYDDIPDEDEEQTGQHQISVGRMDGTDDSGLSLGEVAFDGVSMADPGDSSRLAEACALAGLFTRLWAEKAQGAVIELRLADGETIEPQSFAEGLSRGRHGVFATKERDGSYTLIAVPWEAVDRVVVRGVKELPKEMRS